MNWTRSILDGFAMAAYFRACFKTRKLCAKCQYGKLII